MIAALFVILPYFFRSNFKSYQVTNSKILKQRLVELEQEVSQGVISEKDKDAAIKELKLALYNETYETKESKVDGLSVPFSKVMLAAIPAIVLGGLVYFLSSHYSGLKEYSDVINSTDALLDKIQTNPQDVTPNDYAKYAVIIRKRLREFPEDEKGWQLLGQVYLAIGRVEESIAAYEKAIDLTPGDDELRFKYVNALITSGTDNSLGNAMSQINYLITRDAGNRDYRLMKTVVATQLGDTQTAGENFAMIKDQLSPQSNFYQSLVAQLRNIGVSEEFLGSAVAVTGTSIAVTVNLLDELKSNLPENGYLIVFAQDANGESRAPLAVKRLSLSEFPLELNLSLSDAMIPSLNLDTVDQVKLTARVSKDQDVMPSEGELEGTVNPVLLNKGESVSVSIVINQEI